MENTVRRESLTSHELIVMPRPKDVSRLDQKIVYASFTSSSITLHFVECIDLAAFCRDFLIKLSYDQKAFWAEPIRTLILLVDGCKIDVDKHCFGMKLEIGLSEELIQPGTEIFLFTYMRRLVYGRTFLAGQKTNSTSE